jgi:hypothetical protein
MKKIYIVLAHTGTMLSRIIKIKTGAEYTHVSIALDEDLNRMYSFGRKYSYIAFIGGFVKEGAHFGTFKRFYNTEISVLELSVSDEQYMKLNTIIKYIENHKDEYKFNILGMFLAGFNKRLKSEKTYYCAEFVNYVLKEIDVDVSNLPEIIKPESFKNLKNSKLIYKGLFRTYKLRNKNKEFIEYLNYIFNRKVGYEE